MYKSGYPAFGKNLLTGKIKNHNMKKKHLIIALLVCLSVNTLWAQPAGPVFHLDKPFYVTGEVLQYKLYLSPDFEGQSVALKVALKDAAGTTVDAFYQHTQGATAVSGYLKLSYDLPSAVYHLLVLGTDRVSLQKVKLAETLVPVYNDLTEEALPETAGDNPAGIADADNDLQLSISTAAETIHKRGTVQADIAVTDRNGRAVPAELSVSVIDAGLFGDQQKQTLQRSLAGELPTPEGLSDQMYLNGRITNTKGTPRAEINFGAYIHDLRASLIGQTDAAGNFALLLPEMSGPASIQFIDLRNDSLRVILDDGIELAATPALPFNQNIAEYLKWSRSRKVIYQLYNTVETNLEQERPQRVAQPMTPDQRVILAEYPDFKNLANFFNEVGAPLKFRQDKAGMFTAQMFNPDPRMRVFYQGTPIFIVDGKMTRDVNFVQQLELNKIDTIDLYFDFFKLNRLFDKVGTSGIVILNTGVSNLQVPAGDAANIFWVKGLLPAAREVAPEEISTNRPVFRSGLFWESDLSTGSNGRGQLRFTQSDDLGTFLIQVVARSADGRTATAVHTYEVEW